MPHSPDHPPKRPAGRAAKSSPALPGRRAKDAPSGNGPTGMIEERPAPIDLGILPGLTGYQLRLAQIRVFHHFVHALAGFDLTPGLLGVLAIIGANQGLKQSELAQAVHLDRSTVVGVIDKLEARGWAQRRVLPGDRRAHGLWLTEPGRQALEQSLVELHRHEQHITRELSAEETKTLTSLLARVCP